MFTSKGLLSLFGLIAAASAADTTVRLFIDAGADEKFVGSVISADCHAATYELRCTEGDYGSGSATTTCDSDPVTVTYGPNSFGISTKISTEGVEGTLIENCSLDGTASALCTASISADLMGSSTAISTVSTKTGSDVHFFDVPITPGAAKLPSCTDSAAVATGTANAAAAAATAVGVYKVLIVQGAAALLAGAGVFV